jgi:hypothetical protein
MASIPIFFGDMEASLKAAMIFPREPKKAGVLAAWLILQEARKQLEQNVSVELVAEREADDPTLLDVACAAVDFAYLYPKARKNILDGARAGFVVAILWRLIRDDPHAASWDMAIEVASKYFGRQYKMRATLRDCLSRFQPALHLLGAATMRQSSKQKRDLEHIVILIQDTWSQYSRQDDLLFFVAEAKELQADLISWNKDRSGQSDYINDMIEFSELWNPPARQPHWPDTGRLRGSARVANATIEAAMKPERKRAGRKTASN